MRDLESTGTAEVTTEDRGAVDERACFRLGAESMARLLDDFFFDDDKDKKERQNQAGKTLGAEVAEAFAKDNPLGLHLKGLEKGATEVFRMFS